jgi:hypothetical protein
MTDRTTQERFTLKLYYHAGGHISRTLIAGCTTECGVPLKKGKCSTVRPLKVCERCDKAIRSLLYPKGLEVSDKLADWLRLKDYAP